MSSSMCFLALKLKFFHKMIYVCHKTSMTLTFCDKHKSFCEKTLTMFNARKYMTFYEKVILNKKCLESSI